MYVKLHEGGFVYAFANYETLNVQLLSIDNVTSHTNTHIHTTHTHTHTPSERERERERETHLHANPPTK